MNPMLRRLGALIAALALGGLLALPAAAQGPEIPAPSAILVDAATGTVLFEQDADRPMEPASVTKVMTLLLVMEALDSGKISMEDTVTASETAAAKGGSQIYLEPGETLSMDEMLKSVVVSSANDCATALAEHVAGSETAFVEQMNRRARELGMTNTHFVNCTGLDDSPEAAEHLTTARDIAVMSRALLTHEIIRRYTTIWTDTVRDGKFGLANTNKLVRFYPGTTGLKTGYTGSAGHCLSASAKRDGMELIAVVLGCQSSSDRFTAAKALLDYGFANYALADPLAQAAPAPVEVRLGAQPQLVPVPARGGQLLVTKDQLAGLECQITQVQTVEAPVALGQSLGTLTVTAGGETLAEIPLVADREIPRLHLGQLFYRALSALAFGE